MRGQLTVLKSLSDQCRSTLMKTRDMQGEYVKTVREMNLLKRSNRELKETIERGKRKMSRLEKKATAANAEAVEKRTKEHIEQIREMISRVREESGSIQGKVTAMKSEMDKEVRRSVTEMGMRISDISESKKVVEREKARVENKLKNVMKDYQMMSLALNRFQQRIAVLEKQKQGFIQLIQQIQQGVDQQVPSDLDPRPQRAPHRRAARDQVDPERLLGREPAADPRTGRVQIQAVVPRK